MSLHLVAPLHDLAALVTFTSSALVCSTFIYVSISHDTTHCQYFMCSYHMDHTHIFYFSPLNIPHASTCHVIAYCCSFMYFHCTVHTYIFYPSPFHILHVSINHATAGCHSFTCSNCIGHIYIIYFLNIVSGFPELHERMPLLVFSICITCILTFIMRLSSLLGTQSFLYCFPNNFKAFYST